MTTIKKLRNRWRSFVVIALIIYLLGFVVLWIGGGYILTESGKVRVFMGMGTGIAAPDVAEWQPLFGHCQPSYTWAGGSESSRCDFLGNLYFPLISAVQSYHEPIQMLDDDGFPVGSPPLPQGFKLHPRRGQELSGILAE
jgi:hypothetical protein